MFRELGKLEGGIKGLVIRKINWDIFRPLLRKQLERQPMMASLLSNTTMLTTMNNPPGAPNKIPSQAVAYLDCRLMPKTNTKRFVRKLKNQMDEPRVKVTVIDESPDAKPSKPDFFYEQMKKSIRKSYPHSAVMPILFPATTDNNYYRAKNIQAFGIMPIPMNQQEIASVHSVNEHLKLDKLHKAIRVHLDFLENCMKKEE